MITFSLTHEKDKIKEAIFEFLNESEKIKIAIERKYDFVIILKENEINQVVSLDEKIKDAIQAVFWDKKGLLYKTIISTVEKPLIEFLLEYTKGNKSWSSRILGINRNTLESKIKRLEIKILNFKK